MLKKPHIHVLTRRRIDRLFADKLEAVSHRKLFDDLDTCELCAGYYSRLQTLESALCGVSDSVTPFALGRVQALVLNASKPSLKSRPLVSRGWKTALAGAFTAMVLAWLLLPVTPDSSRIAIPRGSELSPMELVARGSADEDRAGVGIRVFRVTPKGTGAKEKTSVSHNDIITFTYTRTAEKPGYMALFGVQQSGEVLWYYPDYGEEQSIPISGDKIDEPLGDGIDLSVNHKEGWLRIVSVFSDKPISVNAIESRVESLVGKEGTAKDRVPLSDDGFGRESLEYSVWVTIIEGAD